jgi:hypothetical protein
MKLRLTLSTLLLGACIGTASAFSVNIVKIANTSMTTPNNSKMYFAHFDVPFLDRGYTVFNATNTVGSDALYTNIYDNFDALADNKTAVPVGNGTFSSFADSSSFLDTPDNLNLALDNGIAAFVGTDASWKNGVYSTSKQGSFDLVANQTTPIPNGSGDFTGFAYPAVLSNGEIAFWGTGENNQEGVYLADENGILSKLVDLNTAIPDGKGNFTSITYPTFSTHKANSGSFVFIGKGSNKQTGVYLVNGSKITALANQQTQIPGNSVGFFTSFQSPTYDAKTKDVAFIGNGLFQQTGIYIYQNGKISQLADPANVIPGGVGTFTGFANPNIENNFVVFQATGNYNQEGIYIYTTDDYMYKVISNKDKFNGHQIKSISISSHALSGDQIIARIDFTDGSSGIYLITLRDLTTTD